MKQMPEKKIFSNLKPSIYVDALPTFSAAFLSAGISPLDRVTLTGLPDGAFDLTVAVSCTVGGTTVFAYPEKTHFGFEAALFSGKNDGNAVLYFSHDDFTYDAAFLSSLDAPTDAKVCVTVNVGSEVSTAVFPLRLHAANVFSGIELHPEALAAFVLGADEAVGSLLGEGEPLSPYAAWDEVRDKLKQITRALRQRGIICANRDSYSPERRQPIRSPHEMLGKGTAVLSTDELALLFCALAEAAGLSPDIAFVRGSTGTVTVLCGVWVGVGDDRPMLSESITRMRHAVSCGTLVMFEPLTLSAAQNTDILFAAKRGAEFLNRQSSELIVSLDILAARKAGVRSLDGKTVRAYESSDVPRDALAELYTGLTSRPVFALLDGKFEGYDCLPLVVPDFDALCEKAYEGFAYAPLEISDRIDAFAGMDDHFSSFAHYLDGTRRDIPFNKTEAQNARNARGEFAEGLKKRGHVTVGCYEKRFHESASRITFGLNAAQVYLIFGFLRVRERSDGSVRYLPLCFARADAAYDKHYSLRARDLPLIPNSTLASYLDGAHTDFTRIGSVAEMIDAFEKIAVKASASHAKEAEFAVIREAAVIGADLTDLITWNDIRLYAKKMLTSRGFTETLTGVKTAVADVSDSGTPFIRMHERAERDALLYPGTVLVTGTPVGEKLALASTKIAHEIAENHSVLATSDRSDFLDALERTLEADDLDAMTLRLSAVGDSAELLEKLRAKVSMPFPNEKSLFPTLLGDGNAAMKDVPYPEGIDSLREALHTTADAFHAPCGFAGMSLYETLENYLAACDGTEDLPALAVSTEDYQTLDAAGFDALFGIADRLMQRARAANAAVGSGASTPLRSHPLFILRPEGTVGEQEIASAEADIRRILPLLADYRETLYTLGSAMDIRVRDVKTVKALRALGELYRLILTGRDLTIPASFREKDIAAFTGDAERVGKARTRLEAIEYQLRFMNKELFEDIDSVLAGYEESITEQNAPKGSFIKKFMFRRGSRDILLPYVLPEKRAEFAGKNVEDIYRLLADYRENRAILSLYDKDSTAADENAIELAGLTRKIGSTLLDIFPEDADKPEELNRHTARVIGMIPKIAENASVAKVLMNARARFSEVLSDNECLIGRLSATLHADFDSLSYPSGILSFEGLSETLGALTDNLHAMEDWTNWLAAEREASPMLDSFAACLYENGVTDMTDRLFAKSLLLPAVRRIADERLPKGHGEGIETIEKDYTEKLGTLCAHARCRTAKNYAARVSGTVSGINFDLMAKDVSLPLYAFAAKHLEAILKLYPCVLIERSDFLAVTEGREVSTSVIVCEDTTDSMQMLPVLSAAGSAFVLDFTDARGTLARYLKRCGTKELHLAARVLPGHSLLLDYAADAPVASFANNAPLRLITVNGAMRRGSDMANPSEAEAVMAKAIERYEAGVKSIGVFTLTSGQYAYVRHLLRLTADKDPRTAAALESGCIKVVCASCGVYEMFDEAIFTVGAASDANGHIGWHFGAEGLTAAINRIASCCGGTLTVIMSLGAKELSAMRKTGREAAMLADFAAFLAIGVLPMRVTSEDFGADVVEKRMLLDRSGTRRCVGRFRCGAATVSDDGEEVYFAAWKKEEDPEDRLLRAQYLEMNGLRTVSVSPLDFLPGSGK